MGDKDGDSWKKSAVCVVITVEIRRILIGVRRQRDKKKKEKKKYSPRVGSSSQHVMFCRLVVFEKGEGGWNNTRAGLHRRRGVLWKFVWN